MFCAHRLVRAGAVFCLTLAVAGCGDIEKYLRSRQGKAPTGEMKIADLGPINFVPEKATARVQVSGTDSTGEEFQTETARFDFVESKMMIRGFSRAGNCGAELKLTSEEVAKLRSILRDVHVCRFDYNGGHLECPSVCFPSLIPAVLGSGRSLYLSDCEPDGGTAICNEAPFSSVQRYLESILLPSRPPLVCVPDYKTIPEG